MLILYLWNFDTCIHLCDPNPYQDSENVIPAVSHVPSQPVPAPID